MEELDEDNYADMPEELLDIISQIPSDQVGLLRLLLGDPSNLPPEMLALLGGEMVDDEDDQPSLEGSDNEDDPQLFNNSSDEEDIDNSPRNTDIIESIPTRADDIINSIMNNVNSGMMEIKNVPNLTVA